MGCMHPSSEQKIAINPIVQNANLSVLIDQYNLYYLKIQQLRYDLYDELEIPHILDEQNDSPSLVTDELILMERLHALRYVYEINYHIQVSKVIHQKISQLKSLGEKLVPILQMNQKQANQIKKRGNKNLKTDSLISELLIKIIVFLNFFRKFQDYGGTPSTKHYDEQSLSNKNFVFKFKLEA